MKFDDVVKKLGEFGPYQRRIYFLLCLPAATTCMQILMSVFTMAVPDHRCAIPGLHNDTFNQQGAEHAALINATIPQGDSCNYYLTSGNATHLNLDVATDQNIFENGMVEAGTNSNVTSEAGNASLVMASCSRYVYDRSELKKTIITDMDLVCSRGESRTIAQTVQMFGSFAGAVFGQPPSDLIGRHKMLMVSLVSHMVASLSLVWATSFPVVCAMMFINGAATTAFFSSGFVIGMEMVGPNKRVWAGYVMEIFWSLGMILLAPMAYLIRDWQYLQIATSILPIAFLSYFWLIPESPRWLLLKGRISEAKTIIEKAARINKVTIPADALDANSVTADKGQPFWVACQYPALLFRCGVIFYTWFVCSLAFYGLGLNVGSLGGSVYVNFLLSGVMELVAHVGCICLLDRVGRRILNAALMLLAGLACTSTIFTTLYAPPSLQWITIALAMLGKLGIAGGFATIWVYSSELFPTLIRTSGLGVSSAFARIGSAVSPYIANLSTRLDGHAATAVPLMVFGLSAILSGLLLLTLPETLHRRLPDTIMDAVNFTRIPDEDKEMDRLESSIPNEKEDVSKGV